MDVISGPAFKLHSCTSKWTAFGIAENQEQSRHNLMENLLTTMDLLNQLLALVLGLLNSLLGNLPI